MVEYLGVVNLLAQVKLILIVSYPAFTALSHRAHEEGR
jgi:hypothetical protein